MFCFWEVKIMNYTKWSLNYTFYDFNLNIMKFMKDTLKVIGPNEFLKLVLFRGLNYSLL